MLRRYTRLLLLFLFIAPLPAACSAAPQPQPPPENNLPAPVATEPAAGLATPADSTPAPTEPAVAYPDAADQGAAAPTNAAYPAQAQPTLAPTAEPYPGGLIWIIRPVGIQCEAEQPVGYTSLNEAMTTLRAAGISVQTGETIQLPVTTACGSPTSEHYRVQIGAAHLPTVEGMGWTAEE